MKGRKAEGTLTIMLQTSLCYPSSHQIKLTSRAILSEQCDLLSTAATDTPLLCSAASLHVDMQPTKMMCRWQPMLCYY